MSTIKTNNVQLGQSVTATNNFTWYQPASPDGTVRLGNGNAGSVTDLITVGSTGNLTFTGTTETYTNSVVISAASTKTLTLNGGAGSNGLVIDASNNLGLGVTPSAWDSSILTALQVRSASMSAVPSGANDCYLTSNAYYNGSWKYITSTSATQYRQASGTHYWSTAPSGTAGNAISFTQAMTLDASGNLLVGTPSVTEGGKFSLVGAKSIVAGIPQGQITASDSTALAAGVGGAINFSGVYTSGGSVTSLASIEGYKENATNNNYAGALVFKTRTNGGSQTERARIDSSGIVTMNAYGAGAATFSAAGVISSVSDETWKTKDGVPFDTDAMLKKLEPGYWYYNDEKKEIFGVDRQLGFYAQNVNAAIGPEAAPEPEEGKPWGYYDRSVLAVVVMSLQKALSTIESLEARIAALESN